MFALEIILGDFAAKTFSPVIISSVVASVVTRTFMGNHPAFEVPSYSLVSAWEIPLYMVLGGYMGILGVGFTRILDVFEELFDRLSISGWTKPALGGLLLGGIAIFYPQVLADGYDTISLTLYGQIGVGLLLILVVLKMIATSLTLGSGNSGGIFAPALFMGAVGGGAFGFLVNYLFPEVTASPGAYALVGMAGMVAATTHAPITALLIIFEMTSDYRIILPLMVTVVFSALVAGKLFEHSIYTLKLSKRGIDIRGGKDINILRAAKVSEVMDRDFTSIVASTPLAEILRMIEHSRESYFIVVDKQEQLRGVLSFQDIRSLLSEHSLDHLAIAHDLVQQGTAIVHSDDTLEQAYNLVNLRDLKLIPVVERTDRERVIGVVRREDLIDYYNKRLIDTLRQ